jgi:cyanophycin synthetase
LEIEIKKTVYHGPNLHAGFPGILAEFQDPFKISLPASEISRTLEELLKKEINPKQFKSDESHCSFIQCCAFILSNIYYPIPFFKLNYIIAGHNEDLDVSRIFLRFLRLTPANLSIDLALEISSAIFSTLTKKKSEQINFDSFIEKRKYISDIEVTSDMQMLMKIARERDIPYYAATKTYSRIWHYGQGSRSLFTMFMVNQKDSAIAKDLSQNKDWSNEYIQRLGFPSVQHFLTRTYSDALIAVEKLGYPVVVKPVPGTMGRGVTSGITHQAELKEAYQSASKFLSRGILVEKHVEGIDHRLMVYAGKLIWISAKYPASVTGNGQHTILELIEQENRRRSKSDDTKKPIPIDKVTLNILASDNLSLEDRPENGRIIPLRKVANLEMAGVRKDVTKQAHPDNIAMAETVARLFHMDVMGMDFIIEDIGKSWREVPCAIIEINQIPGFSVYWQAERILESMFPGTLNGRIPTILNLNPDSKVKESLVSKFFQSKLRLGQASIDETLLEHQSRGKLDDSIQIRVNSLIADPHCDALIVHTDANSLIQNGLPLDKFDLAILPDKIQPKIKQFIETHCHQVLENNIREHLIEMNSHHVDQLIDRFKTTT